MKCLYPQRKRKTVNGSTFIHEHACGQCAACRITRRSAWKARIMLESLDWTDTSFTTLTYNEDQVPIGITTDGCPQLELNKHDLQNFFKRLRKNTGRQFRYFACGEYGDQGNRPHYHVIIYGHRYTDTDSITKAWSYNQNPIGNIDCGEFTTARAGYVAKYTLKRLGESKQYLEELPPEFAIMSRGVKNHNGIGLQNISSIVAAIYRTAQDINESPIHICRSHFQTITIGGARLPVHPTLKRRVEKEIFRIERSKQSDDEFEKQLRKSDLHSYMTQDQNLIIQGPQIRALEEADRKLLAKRKLRQSNRAKKL